MKTNNKSFWSKFTWIGVLLFGVLSKLKTIIPLLKLSKFGGTFISMGVSVAAYAYLYTWRFAVGLVLMIFIHEMGHVWAAKRKKIPVSAPAFIPFVGALITMKRLPQDAKTEAYIAYGGPLLGTIGAVICYGLGIVTGKDIFYVIAMIGFFLNLFNLIPISPLDGGRIVGAISRWMWIIGVILALGLIILTKSILLIIIFGLFAFEMWGRFRAQKYEARAFTQSFHVAKSRFTEVNAIIPGEKHQRDLAFRHFCRVEDRQEFVEVFYPGIGLIGTMEVDSFANEITQVQLVQTTQESDRVSMYVKFTYFPDTTKQDRYYQVTPMTRLKYGLAYFGLAAFLSVMTILSYTQINQIAM